jgi:hypothetical protein
MEQGMSTTTNAEPIFRRQQEWTSTSGVTTPWIFNSSNLAFVATSNVGTLVEPAPVVLGIEWLSIQVPRLDRLPQREQLPLFPDVQDPLQQAVLHLISYMPEPDDPGADDIEPGLGYGFPG